MKEKFWHNLKWIKLSILVAMPICVYVFDGYANDDRESRSIQANFDDLQVNWEFIADILKSRGPGAFPLRESDFPTIAKYDTLEAFVLDAEKATYLSPPMKPKARRLYDESQEPGYEGRPIDNWTEPVKAARNGNTGTTIAMDYNEDEVIASYGLVTTDAGLQTVLQVKMDLDEAIRTAKPWYLDEIAVSLGCLIVGSIIWAVHGHRDHMEQERQKEKQDLDRWIEAGKEAVKANKILIARNQELEALQPEDTTSELLDSMIGMETVSEWPSDDDSIDGPDDKESK